MGEGKLVATSFPFPIPLSFQKLLFWSKFLGRNLFGEKRFAPNPTSKSLEVEV